MEEASKMRNLDHPNVLHLLAIAIEVERTGDVSCMVLTPFMGNGELSRYLSKNIAEYENGFEDEVRNKTVFLYVV